MRLKFNVFGKIMSVSRQSEEWVLFLESDVGMRTRVYDVIIPSDLKQEELAQYLDDIYHESATANYTSVFLLTDNQ
ncbi:hypothetical protein BKF99_RS23640 [Vibrio parahaemolyticus]|nr:hypothetical protein [Vibrio parahaemolyticus]